MFGETKIQLHVWNTLLDIRFTDSVNIKHNSKGLYRLNLNVHKVTTVSNISECALFCTGHNCSTTFWYQLYSFSRTLRVSSDVFRYTRNLSKESFSPCRCIFQDWLVKCFLISTSCQRKCKACMESEQIVNRNQAYWLS